MPLEPDLSTQSMDLMSSPPCSFAWFAMNYQDLWLIPPKKFLWKLNYILTEHTRMQPKPSVFLPRRHLFSVEIQRRGLTNRYNNGYIMNWRKIDWTRCWTWKQRIIVYSARLWIIKVEFLLVLLQLRNPLLRKQIPCMRLLRYIPPPAKISPTPQILLTKSLWHLALIIPWILPKHCMVPMRLILI